MASMYSQQSAAPAGYDTDNGGIRRPADNRRLRLQHRKLLVSLIRWRRQHVRTSGPCGDTWRRSIQNIGFFRGKRMRWNEAEGQ
jgi:hypothetical protein